MALVYENEQHDHPVKNENTSYFKVDSSAALNPANQTYDLTYRNDKVAEAGVGVAGNCVVKDTGGSPGVYASWEFSNVITKGSQAVFTWGAITDLLPANYGFDWRASVDMSAAAAARAAATRMNRIDPRYNFYSVGAEVRVIHTDFAGQAAIAAGVDFQVGV